MVNLHGNANRGLVAGDENVFDIRQGVAINFFCQSAAAEQPVSLGNVIGHREGSETSKYETLLKSQIYDLADQSITIRDFDQGLLGSSLIDHGYQEWLQLTDIFPAFENGFKSHRDHFAWAFDKNEMSDRLQDMASDSLSDEQFLEKYDLADTPEWNASDARKRLKRIINQQPMQVCVFPFDFQWSFVDQAVMNRPRSDLLQAAFDVPALMTSRQTKDAWDAKAVGAPINHKALAKYDTNYLFPLWLKPSDGERHRRPNIDRASAEGLGQVLNLTYNDGIPRGQQGSLGKDFIQPKAEQIDLLDTPWDGCGDLTKSFGPRDLFDYIYVVMHAPSYRSRYAEFLKSDFPRIPTPGSRALFADLVPLGRELVALHLLKPDEAPAVKAPEIRFAGTGEARVAKGYPEYTNGKVMINASRWFEDVPKTTWEFHVGGYQPCEKWLKDRAAKGGKKQSDGRVLTDDDILHYSRMVVALTETRRIMAEIDQVIEKHGGWPGAFSIASSTAPAPQPELASLPDGSWVWPTSIQPNDRLRYAAQYALWQMDPAIDASRIRFVIASLAEPRLLTPLLSNDDRADWLRLVGPEAQAQTGVTRFRPEVNASWRTMFETLITSGQLTEQSDGGWSRGQHFSDGGLNLNSADGQRAAFVLHAVRMMEVSNLQAALAPEDNIVWANFGHG